MLGLRGRMALTAVAASAAALSVVVFLVGPGLRRGTIEHAREALFAEARLMGRVAQAPLAEGAAPERLDALVDEAAREVRARVTIIAPDGRVLADSAVSDPELSRLENHAERPEVRQALQAGAGSALRHSATVRDELLYAAVAVRSAGRVLGVARVALPLTGVEEQVGALRRAVVLALALAFAITALLTAALSSSLVGPLEDIVQAARRYAAGDLGARIPVRRRDELGELARILNLSLNQLQERLTESARDRARTDAMLKALEDGLLGVDQRGVLMMAIEAV
jgi:two-component system phosphate regulon sensor histidine kinase PhoR